MKLRFDVLSLCLVFPCVASLAETKVDPAIQAFMVLQRDFPIIVSGTDRPGQRVDVDFAGNSASAVVNGQGIWKVSLPQLPAGGPYRMLVSGSSQESIEEVLIGDVWLCSGQSNMEWTVGQTGDADLFDALDKNDSLRLLHIPRHIALAEQEELPGNANWVTATPDSIVDFSAACYFFGESLQSATGIPVGLISASWGGTIIESWISARSLKNIEPIGAEIDLLEEYARDPEGGRKEIRDAAEEWWLSFDPGPSSGRMSGDGDSDREWTPVTGPTDFGSLGLDQFDGSAWYRASIHVPPEFLESDATIHLGCIDDRDTTWLNGQEIGSTNKWDIPRGYRIRSGLLDADGNSILIRVLDLGRDGGLVSCREQREMGIQLGESFHELDIDWEFYLGSPLGSDMAVPKLPYEENSRTPSVLYNGMVASLKQYSIAGVAWYQGESNSDRSKEYFNLLQLLKKDWRGQFGKNLPFLIVQLSAFDDPLGRDWPGLRDAQRRAVESDLNSRLIVTIDAGEKDDIHPKDKKTVGHRLSLAAQDLVYDLPVYAVGPSPARTHGDKSGFYIEFNDVVNGLRLRNGETEIRLEYCESEMVDCLAVLATLANERTLYVQGLNPEDGYVRYAWQNYPDVSLWNSEGLPAGPFAIRTLASGRD